MNEHLKNSLIVLSVTSVILFVALYKPKSKAINPEGFNVPTIAPITDNDFGNAVTSIKAVRSAITANEPKSLLDDLKAQILKDYNIRVYDNNGLLFATDRAGKAIANEQ